MLTYADVCYMYTPQRNSPEAERKRYICISTIYSIYIYYTYLASACTRQHTSAYACIRQHTSAFYIYLASAYVRIRQHTSAYVSYKCVRILLYMCPHTTAYWSACTRQHTSAYACIRQRTLYMCPHTTAYRSACTRQHTSAYACIRQRTLYMCPHATAHLSSYHCM
jgi:hypothetical protein